MIAGEIVNFDAAPRGIPPAAELINVDCRITTAGAEQRQATLKGTRPVELHGTHRLVHGFQPILGDPRTSLPSKQEIRGLPERPSYSGAFPDSPSHAIDDVRHLLPHRKLTNAVREPTELFDPC